MPDLTQMYLASKKKKKEKNPKDKNKIVKQNKSPTHMESWRQFSLQIYDQKSSVELCFLPFSYLFS